MVTIDGKQIAFTTSFMVKNDQDALIDFEIHGTKLRFAFRFKSGVTAADRSGEWRTDESGVVRFTFGGWDNALGTCVAEPLKCGEVGGKLVYFQLAQHFVGEVNLVDLFVLVEE